MRARPSRWPTRRMALRYVIAERPFGRVILLMTALMYSGHRGSCPRKVDHSFRTCGRLSGQSAYRAS
jgi:hypothetical protein